MNDTPGLLLRDPLPQQAVYNRIFAGGLGAGESFSWKPWLPVRERQWTLPFCVTFSRTNCAEVKALKEGLDLNFSDRELGVISGTTEAGNYLDTVSDWFRTKGIVKEEDCPFTDDMLKGRPTKTKAWQQVFALPNLVGKKRYLGGSHSWVFGKAAMIDALSHSPLQIAVGVGSTWENSGVVATPSVNNAFHAVTLYYIDAMGQYHIWDSIGREYKILNASYPIQATLSFRDLPANWKDTMSVIEFVHRVGTPEYGFLEKTSFTEIYHKAIDENDIKFQAIKFGVNVLDTNGNIDFSKARDIQL